MQGKGKDRLPRQIVRRLTSTGESEDTQDYHHERRVDWNSSMFRNASTAMNLQQIHGMRGDTWSKMSHSAAAFLLKSGPEYIKFVITWIKTHPAQTAGIAAGTILSSLTLAMPAVLASFGFGAAGPILGSAAAAWQSSIGATVAAGSAFAFLQSAAMGGAAAGLLTGVGVAGAAVATGVGFLPWEKAGQCMDHLKARFQTFFGARPSNQ